MKENPLLNFLIDNLQKVFYPEDWIKIDLSLSKTELLTLLIVDRHGEIIMSQIADYIRVPLSTATGIVDRLVKNGYLKRERSESDRRIVAIQLTESGSTILKEFKGGITNYIDKIDQSLTEEERTLLFNLFMKITKVLGQDSIEGENTDKTPMKMINIE